MKRLHPSSRRRWFSALVVLLGTVVGVVLMHSVVTMPAASSHEGMSTVAAAMPSVGHDSHGSVAPKVALDRRHDVGEHDAVSGERVRGLPCPGGHDMMHPCVGTMSSWPALTAPAAVIGRVTSDNTSAGSRCAATAALSRAPPCPIPSLDRSVMLRV